MQFRPCKQSHLQCFVAVADLGSVSAAARRLHRTPSAVSMTVSNLEALFGRPLFEPGNKTRLTPFGAYVFDLARDQLWQYDRCMDSIEAFARNDIGRVDIAAVPSFATRYLPALLADYINRYPQVMLSIRDDSSEHINRLVDQGQVDVGIASPAENLPSLQCRPLLSDPLGVVCSSAHPLNELERPLRWADLCDYRFIANGTCEMIRAPEFRSLLQASELDVQNTTSLLALVATGLGITTLPRLAVPEDRDDIVFKTTRYANLERTIGIVTSTERTLSPAAAAFVATVEILFADQRSA